MLLRSSSTTKLNSLLPYTISKDFSPEPEIRHRIPRTRSMTLNASSSSSLSPIPGSLNRMTRALSETDLSAVPKRKSFHCCLFHEDEEDSKTGACARSSGSALFSFAELDEDENEFGARDGSLARELVEGGGGGGCNKNDGGSSRFGDSNHGNDSTDVYYRTMIEANPENPLFLSNYARYLKEVRGDYVKAEEYCGRAILENPNDGSVLSMYADLIWERHNDGPRAETYFDQAVKAAPDDCYVLASYARFLWDAEEEEEEEVEEGEDSFEKSTTTTGFFHGAAPSYPPPLAAAS